MSADPFTPPVTSPRPSKLWPHQAEVAQTPKLLLCSLAVGILAALTVRPNGTGLACVLVGLGILLVAYIGRSSRPSLEQVGWSILTVALLAVAATRTAPWLIALCLLTACFIGTLAVVGGRTWTGLLVGGLSATLVPTRACRWVRMTLDQPSLPALRSRRAWKVGAVTTGLVALFGTLFATADAAYGAVVALALPDVRLPDVGWRLLLLGGVVLAAISMAYLAGHRADVDALAPAPGVPVQRWEWTVPLVVLNLLFASFVAIQLTVLFGGRTHVLATQGLSYAEYARQGFWQLLVVTALTLVVIAVAVRRAPRTNSVDLRVVRSLLALLCVLALVVVLSALHRMSLYQEEYGFTRLRLFVDAVELTLGAIFLLLLASGFRLTSTWLPRAVVSSVAIALLALALMNPDAYIADKNITRYERTGEIDVAYLARLSPDAVPQLMRLSPALRSCALAELAADLMTRTDPWYDVNISRTRARRLVISHPIAPADSQQCVYGHVSTR